MQKIKETPDHLIYSNAVKESISRSGPESTNLSYGSVRTVHGDLDHLFVLNAVGHEEATNDRSPQSIGRRFRHGLLQHHFVQQVPDGGRRYFDAAIGRNGRNDLVANIVRVAIHGKPDTTISIRTRITFAAVTATAAFCCRVLVDHCDFSRRIVVCAFVRRRRRRTQRWT
jgi:hypothetical protein